MLFIEYPTCSTCKRAKKYLTEHNIAFEERNIKEENPTAEELGAWLPKSGKEVKAFFNTSGQVYRSENIKDKLPTLSESEKLALLATNGMLVKRPILILPDTVLVGFKEAEWDEALRRNGFLK
ncbi:MAG: arsenate reductase family protein [Veillonella sp.]|uniref:arsenate reductase family protein n=1 Tax=Veillonella sp. TaxID=1926307 RepID=UPI0025D80BE6|nr:arsenate reductase family protein [Veillonella sp.]MBS4912622.1 arsenate reductase family protein [Veillonella sp.]